MINVSRTDVSPAVYRGCVTVCLRLAGACCSFQMLPLERARYTFQPRRVWVVRTGFFVSFHIWHVNVREKSVEWTACHCDTLLFCVCQICAIDFSSQPERLWQRKTDLPVFHENAWTIFKSSYQWKPFEKQSCSCLFCGGGGEFIFVGVTKNRLAC